MADVSPRCPHCHAIGPRVSALKYRDGVRTVSYQCDACGHAWQSTGNIKSNGTPLLRDE